LPQLNKAIPIGEKRKISICHNVPDAWETWDIILHPGCPENPTGEWLENHRDMWEWDELIDRGSWRVPSLEEVADIEVC
jgi:hypothetical protein